VQMWRQVVVQMWRQVVVQMWRQVVVQMWPRGVAGRPAELPRLGSAGVRTARSAERHPRRTAPTCTSTCQYQLHPTPHRARCNRARSMQHATCTSARQYQLHADDDGAANHTEAMQPPWHARCMACLVCRMGHGARHGSCGGILPGICRMLYVA
jgi:hypothetical protein